jgi:uncharacterized membrane protein YidH (DUF202 family)
MLFLLRGKTMESKLKSMIFGLILILFGVSLIPIVFTALANANWTLATGVYNANATLSTYVSYDLSWIGYIVGLLFALALVGVGVAVLIQGFKK